MADAEAPRRLPGDPEPAEQVARIVRVDQAGEYGAARIYAGQLAILGHTASGPAIRHMAEQEQRHLAAFDRELLARRVRPTLLQPVWHVAGFALGAATALLGEKAAMACTAAVETVIDAHYRQQNAALGTCEPELRAQIEEFRVEEVEHRDTALEAGAEQAPAYPVLSGLIKAGSRAAIWLSTRL